jgi:hypothetical protein
VSGPRVAFGLGASLRRGGAPRPSPLVAALCAFALVVTLLPPRAMARSSLELAADLLASAPAGSVAAVCGRPGTGKSRVVKLAIARHPEKFRRLVVFDPHAKRDRLMLERGAQLYPWQGELVEFAELVAAPRKLLCRSPVALVVDPGTIDRAKLAARFKTTAALAWNAGGLDVIAEEAALYAREATDPITLYATSGRHTGGRLFLISQRFMRVHVDARELLSHVVLFGPRDPTAPAFGGADVRAVRELVDDPTWRPPGGGQLFTWSA